MGWGTPQARAQRTPECQEVASKLPARHHVTHSADARSWAGDKCTENQKTRKNLYITSTPQPMLVRAHRSLDSSRALKKKKKKIAEQRKQKEQKSITRVGIRIRMGPACIGQRSAQKSFVKRFHSCNTSTRSMYVVGYFAGWLGSQGRRKSGAAYIFYHRLSSFACVRTVSS